MADRTEGERTTIPRHNPGSLKAIVNSLNPKQPKLQLKV